MSDYMKEAERLIEDYGNAEWKVGRMSEHSDDAEEIVTRENARAALLAHIQRGAVQMPPKDHPLHKLGRRLAELLDEEQWAECERLLLDGWKHERKVATAEVPMPKPVAYGFGNTAITGHTNRLMMVRIDIPGGDQYAGAFWLPLVLADEAHTYGIACRAAGEAAGYARGVAEGVARTGLTPAEVPMPEPDYRGPAEAGDYFSGYTHTTMRTYGAAREAAGYARALAESGRDAERRGQFLVECNDVALRIDPFGYGIYDAIDGDGQPYQSQALADEIAALRGEVK